MKKLYTLQSQVCLYPGMAGWHFIGVPKKESLEIKNNFGAQAKGWGSLRVAVTIGETTWETSIFPDKKTETYLLPLKMQVRKKEGLFNKDKVKLKIKII